MKSFYPIFQKANPLKLTLLLFIFSCTSNISFGQIIPTAGETECFIAGNGGVFVDNGGTESNPTALSDPPGFYINCGCETVTTLCSPDGSAITIDFVEFDVFSTFDFVEIYDGEDNTGTLLYGNGAGAPNTGDQFLDDMLTSNGSTSFTGTTGCITVVFFATAVVNQLGWEANVTTASGASHPGDNLECGTNLNCLAPPNIGIDNILDITADVFWSVADSADSYNIEYGLDGFALGTGTMINTADLGATLTGLSPLTTYDFYVQSDCGGGDMSNFAGPFSFTTNILNDVGIISILSPMSGCGLSDSSIITVQMQNFGALPQSLVPFKYSVNGVEAAIPIPLDGFYTNVIGTDSIETLEFTTTWDFSQPGDYVIAAWTELDTDLESSNDTSYFTITSIPIISDFPYDQGFEDGTGGWSVGEDGQNQSWSFGEPNGLDISEAANGINAWVTNLDGTYNNNELSYLVSNCFDFSNLTNDPAIAFSLYYETETNWDGAWLEVSVDGGSTWSKVGAIGSGLNWYNINNTTQGLGDVWAGNSEGWIIAKNSLTGTAGESDVLLRFAFDTDGSGNFFDGIGVDDISIFEQLANDMASQSVTNVSASACGDEGEVSLTLFNNGTATQSGFDVSYQVNGGLTVTENVGLLSLAPNEIADFVFATPFDNSMPGDVDIIAWAEVAGDGNTFNDTTSFSFINFPIVNTFPFTQDFESGNGGWFVGNDSQNPTWAFGQPVGPDINTAASGINAWVTNLAGNYNNGELSYLVSNCMDFSSLTDDPTISFSLYYDTETTWDGGWLESSVDGGNTWTKVGAIGTGINWYNINNTNQGLGDVWGGNSAGWIFAKNSLAGTAGSSEVLLRFAFDSDGSVNGFDGIGVDDISIFIPVANDMASQSVSNSSTAICGDPMDEVTLTIVNNGTATQTGFDVSYQVNGGIAVTENVGALTLAPDETGTYTFTTPFNSAVTGDITITAWTELAGELNVSNDTTNFVFEVFRQLPFKEDFEGQTLPNGWTSDEFNPVSNAHNNISYVAFDNLWSSDPSFELVSPAIGPITTGDSLFFDYRYVDFSGNGTNATTLGAGDELNIRISTNCGLTFSTVFTIDQNNHVTSNQMANIGIDLSSFDGESILVLFQGLHGTGDYYLDIDNINVFQCAPLDLTTESTPELDEQMDGTATVTTNGNSGPYTYNWDFGGNTASVTGLATGDYSVTVTDAFGCSDITTVSVGMETNTTEIEEIQSINLFPNPTTDIATLEMVFNESVDLQVQLLNMMGQVVYEQVVLNTSEERLELNLNDFPSGMYFVRINVDDQSLIKKLSKTQP